MDLPCRLLLSSCFGACLKVTSAVMLCSGLFPSFLSHYFRSLSHLSLSFFYFCRREFNCSELNELSRPTFAVHTLTGCSALCLCLGMVRLTIAFAIRCR